MTSKLERQDCSACGNRMENKVGHYNTQDLRIVKPYCANPDCKLFNKKRKLWYD